MAKYKVNINFINTNRLKSYSSNEILEMLKNIKMGIILIEIKLHL